MHVMKHASFEYRQKVRLKAAALFAEGRDSNSEISHKLMIRSSGLWSVLPI